MVNEQQSWRNCEYAIGTKPVKGGLIVETYVPKKMEHYDCKNRNILDLGAYPTEMVTVDANSPRETPILYMGPRPFVGWPEDIEKSRQEDNKLGLAMCMHCSYFKSKPQKTEKSKFTGTDRVSRNRFEKSSN